MSDLNLHGAWLIPAMVIGNGGVYFALGSLFHRLYYVRRAQHAERWRLQPDRPVPDGAYVRGRLPLVLLNIALFNGVVGAALYLALTGRTQAYLGPLDGGWVWLVLGGIAPYLIFHAFTFYVHRALHTRWLFKHIHSVHHRARAPIWIDAHYMHPLEAIYSGVALVLPLFVAPMWLGTFGLYALITGLHELGDHTGVRLRPWPLSASLHHDQHHRRVNLCYGQLLPWLDRLHGTGLESHTGAHPPPARRHEPAPS